MSNPKMNVLYKARKSDMTIIDLHFQGLCEYYSKYLVTKVCFEKENRVIVSFNN